MSIVILGVVILYVFYKLVCMDNSDNDDIDDFLVMKDATTIARGENPLDPKAYIKSVTDPLDIFDDN